MHLETKSQRFPGHLKIALRSAIQVSEWREKNETVFRFEDPVSGKFFHSGRQEAEFLQALRADSTLSQVLDQQQVSERFAEQLLTKAAQAGLLQGVATERLMLQQRKSRLAAKRLTGWNPLSFRIPLFSPNGCLEKLKPLGSFVFSRWSLVIWCIVVAWGVATAVTHWNRLLVSSGQIIAPENWLALIGIWLVLKTVHEFAHGIAAKKHDVEVKEAGVLMLLLTPLAYVDVSDMWRLRSKKKRLVIVAAGMYVEIFLAFIALIVGASLSAGPLSNLCVHAFFLGTATTILFNANPLMRFDGYYLLTDALGIKNLYRKGSQWWSQTWQQAMLGIQPGERICRANEKIIVAIYGFLAFLWKISIAISLTLGAILLVPDWGLLLGSIAAICWGIIPLALTAKKVFRERHRIQPQTAAIAFAVFAVLGGASFWVLSAPATLSAPALVQFRDDAIVRAPADGFVANVMVAEGDYVEAGAPLLAIENQELEIELRQIELDIKKTDIQIRIHRRNGDHELALGEQEQRQAFEQQRRELQQNLEQLVVRAEQSGVVMRDDLAELEGRYVRQGDRLVSLVDLSMKKVLISIDQSNEKSLTQLHSRDVKLLFPNRHTIAATVSKIDPSATTTPAHFEWTSVHGGSIPVRQLSEGTEESKIEFLSPRIQLELNVSTEDQLRLAAGERGIAILPATSQSLGTYLYLQVTDWFGSQVARN